MKLIVFTLALCISVSMGQVDNSTIISNSTSVDNSTSIDNSTIVNSNSSSAITVDYLTVRFTGDKSDLMNCSYQISNSSLSCQNSYRSLVCDDSFDIRSLGNFSFSVYGFENIVNSYGLFSSNLIKYDLFPFKLNNSTNDANNTLVYDYVIPIYGFEVKLTLDNGKLISSNGFSFKEVSCFNKLVFLLNEAKLYDQMRVVSYLTGQDIIQQFKFDLH